MRSSCLRHIGVPTLAGLVLLLAAGCTDEQTTPLSPTAPEASTSTTTAVFKSGSHVTAWDPIFPASADGNWPSTVCKASPAIGPDAKWVNPHFASVTPRHPWENSYAQAKFDAPWINAWEGYYSKGPGGHSWTKYQTTIRGEGDHVVQFLADNCSWVYLDDKLVGVQSAYWNHDNSGKYPVTLSGEHKLTFIIFDGGGLAGGKFRLETRESFVGNGGNTGWLPKPSGDSTPPSITPIVAGTLGDNSWYTSDVKVSWKVADGESTVSSAVGCDASAVSSDTGAATFTCKATSAGGTASKTATVKRDATVPALAFSGNQGTYTVDQTVAIGCSASDATSGLATSDCPAAKGDAYTFALGTNALSATATDLAGNDAAASASFTVQVTTGSLCALTQRWVSKAGVAHSLCKQLDNRAIRAYQNHLRAQTGKSITSAHAAILNRLADAL